MNDQEYLRHSTTVIEQQILRVLRPVAKDSLRARLKRLRQYMCDALLSVAEHSGHPFKSKWIQFDLQPNVQCFAASIVPLNLYTLSLLLGEPQPYDPNAKSFKGLFAEYSLKEGITGSALTDYGWIDLLVQARLLAEYPVFGVYSLHWCKEKIKLTVPLTEDVTEDVFGKPQCDWTEDVFQSEAVDSMPLPSGCNPTEDVFDPDKSEAILRAAQSEALSPQHTKTEDVFDPESHKG